MKIFSSTGRLCPSVDHWISSFSNSASLRNRRNLSLSLRCGLFFLITLHPSPTGAFSGPLLRRSFSWGSVRSLSFLLRSSATTTSQSEATNLSTLTMENPLLQQDGLPKFHSIEPHHVTPAVDTLLADMQRDFERLQQEWATLTTTCNSQTEQNHDYYSHLLPAVERAQAALTYAWSTTGHLNGVKNTEALRQAYQQAQPKIVQATSQWSQSKPLYQALQVLSQQQQQQQQQKSAQEPSSSGFVEGQKRRAVEIALRDMTLGGVGLSETDQERFNQIRMRLAELGTTFSNHVLDDTKAYALTLHDPAQVEGVPDSAKAMWAQAHTMHQQKEQKEKGETDAAAAAAADATEEKAEGQGPCRITLDMPSYVAAMSHLKDRHLREQIYRAYIQRASELTAKSPASSSSEDVNNESGSSTNNVPLIYEILTLRAEMARLLGYETYAQLSLASKMAPTVDAVRTLTDMMAEKALPAAWAELEEITALARSTGGPDYSKENLTKLAPWDLTYWSERLKESKFDLTEEQLRPYFALPAVLDGMFGLVQRIFGVEVRPADGEAEIWHPDVRFFKVFDVESNQHVASFYLDPYSRPQDKRGGAWMAVCVNKSEATKRDIPVAYLTCNGSPPVGEKPSLMTFREVTTLFHEFGHGLQHMLTKATVGDVSGISGIEWDAVELPSQFMENWCYDRQTIYGFAKHWETGEPLPQEWFEKLVQQKTFNSGMMTCRQLYFGQVDMELHSNFDAEAGAQGRGESIFDVQQRMALRYTPYNIPLPEDRFLCSFSHIFAGGYSAAYYSYKWAEVMSADAFAAFEEVGLENQEEIAKIGHLFRDTVLSYGGGVGPDEVFRQFRGRDPSPEALLRHNGLL